MTLRRSLLELLACLAAGAITGAVLMLTWHGLEPTARLGSALLRYVCGETTLSP